jgi:mannose-P-dolichol utilization defect protein 1
MLIQNFIIINLLWSYNKDTSMTKKLFVSTGLFMLLTYLYTDAQVPAYLWSTLISMQILFLTYSRLPQIIHNFNEKSTGQLSLTTFFMNGLGNFVRLLTILKEINDVTYILTSFLSFSLNATICTQIIMYKSKKSNTHTLTETESVEKGVRSESPVLTDTSDNSTNSGAKRRANK